MEEYFKRTELREKEKHPLLRQYQSARSGSRSEIVYSDIKITMVEPLSLSIAGTGVSALLKRVIDGMVEAAEITVYYKKYCKELQDLLERLQPLVDDIGRQTLPSNPGNAFTSGSAVGAWLGKLRDMLEDAETEVNKCIEQQPNFSPWSRHKIGEVIKKVTKSLQEFLQDAALVGVVSQIIHAKYFENMMKENREYMLSSMENMIRELSEDISRHKRRENDLSNVTRELLEGNSTQCSAQEVTTTIQYVLQNQSIGTSDGMSRVDETGQKVLDIMQLRVDIGTSSSSSCPREQRACEVTQKLTGVQRVPPLVFGLDNCAGGVKWGTLSKVEQKRVINQLKRTFRNERA